MWSSEVKFQNMECRNLQQSVREAIDEMVQLSPSDSAVHATFNYIQNRFWAEIKISSESAYLSVIDDASSLADLLDRLNSRFMVQIRKWRTRRFTP